VTPIRRRQPSQRDATFTTRGGITVHRHIDDLEAGAEAQVTAALDRARGVLLTSRYEYPGRYTPGLRGFVNPPLALTGREREFWIEALNDRGTALLEAVGDALVDLPAVEALVREPGCVTGRVAPVSQRFPEEERSKQHTLFSVLRALLDLFHAADDPWLGLYGAFGYDLVFQFEDIERTLERTPGQRDLVLYLPDELIVSDPYSARRVSYEFEAGGRTTAGLPRTGAERPYEPSHRATTTRDHGQGDFASSVRRAKEAFRRGDLFEVVLGQTFFSPSVDTPSSVFRRLLEQNPAPYGALVNLGDGEYLISGSPEMYVRVVDGRVESCPISGTVARGNDVFEDERNIRTLLNSTKDESELTMCTDVDRNDKSRICKPGSVRVIGRRQIELYSRVIHTVDHVVGELQDGFDAVDAFLSHMWAVTITGAPKLWAIRFIEQIERSPRRWYGGAFGYFGFDGTCDSGLTLRTVRIQDGVAELRAGSTLLIDSDPDDEERESELKASAFLEALKPARPVSAEPRAPAAGAGVRILLIDHQDSFVHTLANYLRQTGATVRTVRAPLSRDELLQHLDGLAPVITFLSPGPGRPSDFDVSGTVATAMSRMSPVFGVCLGLQGIVEHFGGELDLLPYPMHGKVSDIEVLGGRLFTGLPRCFRAGRYHSLCASPRSMPPHLRVTARTGDVVMAIEHDRYPIAAVQFHPESIMSADDHVGLRLIENVVVKLSDPLGWASRRDDALETAVAAARKASE
jgi:anthranilate synthase